MFAIGRYYRADVDAAVVSVYTTLWICFYVYAIYYLLLAQSYVSFSLLIIIDLY